MKASRRKQVTIAKRHMRKALNILCRIEKLERDEYNRLVRPNANISKTVGALSEAIIELSITLANLYRELP